MIALLVLLSCAVGMFVGSEWGHLGTALGAAVAMVLVIVGVGVDELRAIRKALQDGKETPCSD